MALNLSYSFIAPNLRVKKICIGEILSQIVPVAIIRRTSRMKCLGILLTAALLAMAPGYGSAQSAGEKSASPATKPKAAEGKGTPARAAKSYTPEERQAYQQKVAADLDKLRQRIEALPGNYETVSPQLKRTLLRSFHGLQKQLHDTQNQLAALEKATAKDWSGLKGEMDKAMTKLTDDCKEAESRLQ
jgi:hypothetical protein